MCRSAGSASRPKCRRVICFLLSPAASYVTGVTVRIDGGSPLGSPLFPPPRGVRLPPSTVFTAPSRHACWRRGRDMMPVIDSLDPRSGADFRDNAAALDRAARRNPGTGSARCGPIRPQPGKNSTSAVSCCRANGSSACSTAARRSSNWRRSPATGCMTTTAAGTSWAAARSSASASSSGKRCIVCRQRFGDQGRHDLARWASRRRCAPTRSPSRTVCRSSIWSRAAAPICIYQAEMFVEGGALLRQPGAPVGGRNPADRRRARFVDRGRRLSARPFRLRRAGAQDSSKIFLAGPPLVKAAIGEDADRRGARRRRPAWPRSPASANTSSSDDAQAHCAWRAQVLAHLPGTGRGSAGLSETAPRHRGIARHRPRRPAHALRHEGNHRAHRRRQRLPRIQGGVFARYAYAAMPRIAGHRRSASSPTMGRSCRPGSVKAAQFIQLCDQAGVPLVFLQNTTGYMVGTRGRARRRDQARI